MTLERPLGFLWNAFKGIPAEILKVPSQIFLEVLWEYVQDPPECLCEDLHFFQNGSRIILRIPLGISVGSLQSAFGNTSRMPLELFWEYLYHPSRIPLGKSFKITFIEFLSDFLQKSCRMQLQLLYLSACRTSLLVQNIEKQVLVVPLGIYIYMSQEGFLRTPFRLLRNSQGNP